MEVYNIIVTTVTIRLTQMSKFLNLTCGFIFLLPRTIQTRRCVRVMIVAVKSKQCALCVLLLYVILLTVTLFSGNIVTGAGRNVVSENLSTLPVVWFSLYFLFKCS